MKLVVCSSKICWRDSSSPSGFSTDGGFAYQMRALAELFDETTLLLPCHGDTPPTGRLPLTGPRLRVRPLSPLRGTGAWRKVAFLVWAQRNLLAIAGEIVRADAVHAPIPGDVGTLAIAVALLARKPLLVRHCGNWRVPRTIAEHGWRWLMETFAGGTKVMLATGGDDAPPSERNADIRWIFSTTLSAADIERSRMIRERPSQSPRIAIACRQDPEKGTALVLEAVAALREQNLDLAVDVIGDGPSLAMLRDLAVARGIGDRVVFHGRVKRDEVLSRLRAADLFCYPTQASEGFPKVVLEALCCGLPVVTTPVSVLPHLVDGAGIIVEDPTPETLAAAIRRCLAEPSAYRAMSERAVAIANEYSLERWRDTIGDLLRSRWGELRSDEA